MFRSIYRDFPEVLSNWPKPYHSRHKLANGVGSTILTSSIGSFDADEGLVAYGASKSAVNHLCRQLAAEWAPRCLRVNAVAPGYMNSHMRGTEGKFQDETFRQQVRDRIPMGRSGELEELVGPVAFLLSEVA